MFTRSLHASITNDIVEMLQTTDPNSFELPWTRSRLTTPRNVVTKKPYNGINRLALWAASLRREYRSGLFATYRQWQSLGAQVRRSERAITVVFYKPLSDLDLNAADSDSKDGRKPDAPRSVARSFPLFAAEQVEGFDIYEGANEAELPVGHEDALASVARFIAATGAQIVESGERAFYRPSADTIHLPRRSAFVGTQTLSPTEAFVGTALHELAHWSGHPARLNRDLTQRFGSEAYAMEELIAELASAFLCVELGVTPTPRPDHAHYLKNWLQVLQSDDRAIFAASSKASEASSYLHRLQPQHRETDHDVAAPAQGGAVLSSTLSARVHHSLAGLRKCAPNDHHCGRGYSWNGRQARGTARPSREMAPGASPRRAVSLRVPRRLCRSRT